MKDEGIREGVRKRMSSEDRQSVIVRVAVELAAEKEVGSVTTQDMADAMQLTRVPFFAILRATMKYGWRWPCWATGLQWVKCSLLKTAVRL